MADEPAGDANTPALALGAWALVIAGLIAAAGFGARAPGPAPLAFSFAPALTPKIDNATVSRGTVAREGVERGAVLSPPLVAQWSRPINVGVIGGGGAEPAVDASGIYVGADTGFTRAFDADGHLRWTYVDANAAAGLGGAPALDSRQVYLGTTAGNLIALDKTSGRVNWMYRFARTISGSPLVMDEFVYAVVSTGEKSSYLVKIHRGDGALEWRSEEIAAESNSGLAIDRVAGLAFVGAADHAVRAFSLKTGRVAWRTEVDAAVDAHPVVIAGNVFVTSNGEFHYALRAATGAILWKTLVLGGSRAPATWEPTNNLIVFGTSRGVLYALDRHSGKTRWIDRTGTIFSGLAGALAVGNSKRDSSSRTLWVTCADLIVCGLDPRTGKITQQIRTGGPVASNPVAFDDALYLVESTGDLRRFAAKR